MKSTILTSITIGLIFIVCLFFLINKENDALQIHAQLESLKIEIEIDINNENYDAASNKLIKLVHPSSDYSTIEHHNDLNSRGFWNDMVKSGSSKYRFNEYWDEQRTMLLEKIFEAKKVKNTGSINADNY